LFGKIGHSLFYVLLKEEKLVICFEIKPTITKEYQNFNNTALKKI